MIQSNISKQFCDNNQLSFNQFADCQPNIFSQCCQNFQQNEQRQTTIIEQKTIVDIFYKGIPLNQRKLLKIQAKKPQQSAYRIINNLSQSQEQDQKLKCSKIQVISSFINNQTHEESQSNSYSMSSYSSQSKSCPYRYITSKNKNSQIPLLQKRTSHISMKYEEYSRKIQPTDIEFQTSVSSDENKIIAARIEKNQTEIRNQKNKFINQKEGITLDNNISEWGLPKRIKQNEDQSIEVEKTQLERYCVRLGRVLYYQDGRVFEQLSTDPEQNSSVGCQTNWLIKEIQQTQQSLISFLKRPSKINSLSQHLSILNKCILMTSSTSVGKEVDKFLSTFHQFKGLFSSGVENLANQSLQQKESLHGLSLKIQSFQKPQQFSESELHSHSRRLSNCTTLPINSKGSSQQTIEAQSDNTNFLSSSENSMQAVRQYCQKLFQFKIKDFSLLSQYDFSQVKKKNIQLDQIIEGKEEHGQEIQFQDCSHQDNSQYNQIRQENSDAELYPSSPTTTQKYGKFHNYNKLFMYNILNMFQTSNLFNFGVPENIQIELQSIISKLKVSAKKNSRVKGKYPFDYFSHAHYNVLFLQITPLNIRSLQQSDEIVNLYFQCFKINLNQTLTSQQLSYINLIKAYSYSIFMKCINMDEMTFTPSGEIMSNSTNPRVEYTIKVIKGIQKLAQGIIIKRF